MSDVCLILEGTYPYVTGGVSTCVHQLIEETPNINYSIIFIGSTHKRDAQFKYKLPRNIKVFKELYLFDSSNLEDLSPKKLGLNAQEKKIIKESLLFAGDGPLIDLYQLFFDPDKRRYDPEELFYSQEVWEMIEENYHSQFKSSDAPSFIDFFYTWRFSNYPIFKIFSMDIPKASIYHTMCTGYAGLLGCMAKEKFKRPLILTEHGIYTHERKIEISMSDWLYSPNEDLVAEEGLSYFKKWWYNLFYVFGKLTYNYANSITTLYEGNKKKQIELGADPDKIIIIPNGIKEEKIKEGHITQNLGDRPEKIIALVGRVVPIKDIKMFIKAVAYIYQYEKNFKALILGPTNEDEDYFQDCQTLSNLLGLNDIIQFTGKVDVRTYYGKIDVLALSSISEGQPLAVLEAFAYGIPVVTTDVGSCSELVLGRTAEDLALGRAGFCVKFGQSEELGSKILFLLQDREQLLRMGEVAYQRFKLFYQEKYTMRSYLNLYNRYLSYTF